MSSKELAELLVEVGHVGEVGRFLSVLCRFRAPLATEALVDLVNGTAGAGHRYPKPFEALQLGLRLGLIEETRGKSVRPTDLGRRFAELPGKTLLDLGVSQGRLLLGLLLDDPSTSQTVRQLFGQFQSRGGNFLAPLASLPQDVLFAAALMQQLGALSVKGGSLLVATEFEEVLAETLASSTRLGEEDLWRRLDAQRVRARMVEERVVLEEGARLSREGRSDLGEAVHRVSAVDAGAGYDILSFESDGSPRHVEVKSSVGSALRFQWSEGERKIAARLGDCYWLYFVPTAHALPLSYCPVLMIRNPMAHVLSGRLAEESSSYRVRERAPVAPHGRALFSADRHMLNWPSVELASGRHTAGR